MSRQLFWMLNGAQNISNEIFQVNIGGIYTIDYLIYNGSSDLEIDWGDGTVTSHPSGFYSGAGAITHSYAGGSYTVKFSGELDQITRLDLTGSAALQSVDLSYFTNPGFKYLFFNNNSNLSFITLQANHSFQDIRLNNNSLNDIDFRGSTYSASTGNLFDVSGNGFLNSISNITATQMNIFDCSDNGMSQAEIDSVINDVLYPSRTATPVGASISTTIIGSTSPNATPSGTYDGTTDWSGGAPTTPMAKIYDMENDITGTYSFDFTDIP